jgi:hypothetical protein
VNSYGEGAAATDKAGGSQEAAWSIEKPSEAVDAAAWSIEKPSEGDEADAAWHIESATDAETSEASTDEE